MTASEYNHARARQRAGLKPRHPTPEGQRIESLLAIAAAGCSPMRRQLALCLGGEDLTEIADTILDVLRQIGEQAALLEAKAVKL